MISSLLNIRIIWIQRKCKIGVVAQPWKQKRIWCSFTLTKISFGENHCPQRSYSRNKSLTQSFLMWPGIKKKKKISWYKLDFFFFFSGWMYFNWGDKINEILNYQIYIFPYDHSLYLFPENCFGACQHPKIEVVLFLFWFNKSTLP